MGVHTPRYWKLPTHPVTTFQILLKNSRPFYQILSPVMAVPELKDTFLVLDLESQLLSLSLESQVLGASIGFKSKSFAFLSPCSHHWTSRSNLLFPNHDSRFSRPVVTVCGQRPRLGYTLWHQWRNSSVSSSDTTRSALPLTNGSFR